MKASKTERTQKTFQERVVRDFKMNKGLYLLVLPVLVYYILFHYLPIYGAQIAFRMYIPALGITESPWVGLDNFRDFFTGIYFRRLLTNTLRISLSTLAFGFPIPIILALLINELRGNAFKRIVQNILYLPHFVSLIVICSMVIDFTKDTGVINSLLSLLDPNWQKVSFLIKPEYFTTIYVLTTIWQTAGWNSIIYIAAVTGIDQELYEAAAIDGAGRLKQTLHITLPGLLPTIIIMLILQVGRIMSIGAEKIILLYNSATWEKSDVISSYVYRIGLQEMNFSFSAAVGLFNSVINFALLAGVNWISRKVQGVSLW